MVKKNISLESGVETHTYNVSTGEKLGQEDSNESEGSLDYKESISKTNKKVSFAQCVRMQRFPHTYGAGSSEVQLQQRTCDALPSFPWHCKHTFLARTPILTATEHRNNKRVQEAKHSKRFTKQG